MIRLQLHCQVDVLQCTYCTCTLLMVPSVRNNNHWYVTTQSETQLKCYYIHVLIQWLLALLQDTAITDHYSIVADISSVLVPRHAYGKRVLNHLTRVPIHVMYMYSAVKFKGSHS